MSTPVLANETGMVLVDSVGSEVGDTDGAGVDDRK